MTWRALSFSPLNLASYIVSVAQVKFTKIFGYEMKAGLRSLVPDC